jgi:hypothetical protein
MSENSANTAAAGEEKPSKLKQAFQWVAAVAAPFGGDAPQYGYNQAGATWDYVKTWVGSKRGPKLT